MPGLAAKQCHKELEILNAASQFLDMPCSRCPLPCFTFAC